jgi:hydroxylaminobenzene mutase
MRMSKFEAEGDRERRLLWHGMILFLLGLLVGLAENHVINPRMGLAAHLEGLMNGTFLVAVGVAWHYVDLTPGIARLAFWMLLYGAYANLFVTTLAAVIGASSLSPVTGAGHKASEGQETLVTIGFVTVGIAMLVSTLLIIWGLQRRTSKR